MASTDKPAETITPPPPPPAAADYFNIDVVLRFLLFASSLVAVVVLVTSDQTEVAFLPGFPPRSPNTGFPPRSPNTVKFKHSPALIYFLAAFSVAGLYSIITTLVSISVILNPDLKLKFLLHFVFWDTLILGIIASATGTAAGVTYVGLKGNDHVGWVKVCDVYDKFCSYLAGSLAVALFGSIITVLLIWLSAHSLHSRIPK